MGLTDNLIGYWELEEASGGRADSHTNALTMTDNNTVTQAVGKVGNAAQFTAANTEFLSRASESLLQTGDIDFTWCTWAWLDSKTTFRILLAKAVSTSLFSSEYIMYYDQSADRFRFGVGDGTANFGGVNADALGSPATGTWYFILGWHDAAANTVNIQVNNGTVNSASYTQGGHSNASALTFGIRVTTSLPHDGRLDQIGFWKRTLTSQERADLYNGGAGLAYSALLPAGQPMALRRAHLLSGAQKIGRGF